MPSILSLCSRLSTCDNCTLRESIFGSGFIEPPRSWAANDAIMELKSVCIATFPCLLGGEVLAVPRIGTINLHTSLLPRYRGPAPLFWMARAGETQGGVTIHWVDAGEDTGDILLQEAFAVPDGMTSEQLLRRVGEVGPALMARAVESIADAGRSVSARVQSKGGRNPRPRPEDAEIDPAWGARRIHNFVRLARKWQTPWLLAGGVRYDFDDAVWLPERRSRDTVVSVRGHRAAIACPDGTVELWKRGRLAKALDAVQGLPRRKAGRP